MKIDKQLILEAFTAGPKTVAGRIEVQKNINTNKTKKLGEVHETNPHKTGSVKFNRYEKSKRELKNMGIGK